MSSMSTETSEPVLQECEECVAPADAFALVANETRLSILEALWAADERPVRFSDLRSAVGMRDSAQFNYHLGKLTDQFVLKTDDGYDLRHAGEKVVRAVLAGSFNEHPSLDPFRIDDPCTHCGDQLEVSYEDEMLSIACPACGHGHGEYSFPPGGLNGRDREELLRAFDQRVRHLHCLAKDGVCPECNGRMQTTIERAGDCCLGAGLRAEHVCEQCRHELCSAVGLALLDQSAVVAFHDEHGVDLGQTPYWRLAWCVDDRHATVLSEDPLELRVDITLDDETLHVTLDEDLAVRETRRSPDGGR